MNKYAAIRHALVFLSILFNIATIGLVVLVHQCDVFLPPVGTSLQKFLPTFASLVGQIVVCTNAIAISSLVTAFTKKKISDQGVTFEEMNHLHSVANGKLPHSLTPIAFVAIVIMLAQGFFTTAIVNSVSPDIMNWGTTHSMPIIDLAMDTNQVNVTLVCSNGNGDINLYGYGTNCPLNNAYGVIYNVSPHPCVSFTTQNFTHTQAYIDSLGDKFPISSTRDGVSYPSTLLGISGSISTLSTRYARDVSGNPKRSVLPTDTFDFCVPKVNVTATCNPNLDNGQTAEVKLFEVPDKLGCNSIATFRIRNSDGSYVEHGYKFGPVYANGAISIFQDDDYENGETVITILSTGKYAENLSSPIIQCRICAHQYLLPIRIVGNNYVQTLPSLQCLPRPEPSPSSLLQVVRIAPMALVKSQGQDGRLDAISLISPQTRSTAGGTIRALELALERMASVGATEMYGLLDGISNITWPDTANYTFATRRYKLGVSGKYSPMFLLSPGILLFALLWGWAWVGFAKGVDGGFNPLHPSCTAAAGMKREILVAEVVGTKDADEDELDELDVIVKYGYVDGTRLGLEASGGQPTYSRVYKDFPPGSPIPTPSFNNPEQSLYSAPAFPHPH
ncbi:uncharacterized protein EI90DRAFT_2997054 [Cantharellus anzutake]|uniref:uncharacterized protein n=1 Tax=Cantharellus anzutake TaxID=1750568 RepID=UPI00190315F8|nr:uncharacterized protein EI90DRAFT_2997054 [Cantharellus anzutake]KAF8329355.1 hypothetical protein EI90DRAFT_2997054 [Cantharellus anzutake]